MTELETMAPLVIRSDGRPSIVVTPRDRGGFTVAQGRNRIWLSLAETRMVAAIFTEGKQ